MENWGGGRKSKKERRIEMKKLVDVLRNIESFEWSKALFLPEDEIWGNDTKCMILDPNDVEDDEVPQTALENGLCYALDVQLIQAIVQNISEQKKDFTDEDLLEAFLYYYDNDAYIELGEPLNQVPWH